MFANALHHECPGTRAVCSARQYIQPPTRTPQHYTPASTPYPAYSPEGQAQRQHHGRRGAHADRGHHQLVGHSFAARWWVVTVVVVGG